MRLTAAAAVLVTIGAGCSSDKQAAATTTERASSTSESTVDAATTTPGTDAAETTVEVTESSTETTTSGADATLVTESTGGSSTEDTTDGTVDVWTQNAQSHSADIGKTLSIDCTPNGTLGSIWGTETYTDDSSICTAAVHVGLITVDKGGTIDYKITAGAASYAGMDGNGITSQGYGAWSGSFIFPKAAPGTGTFTASTTTWDANASSSDHEVGDKIVIDCSSNGHISSIWGTKSYTSDSSICAAAVLEGLITVDKGGLVVAEITAGAESYTGSTAHGVTSSDYGPWALSFVLPENQTPPATKAPSQPLAGAATTTPTT